ncbi:uncharacterized protein PGTG_20982 [Puccinia graminis f. sp. tritici CRL 75-36-700-3]|uniref:Uncharacterized protein n=1 Tax=Puccinia graminis f. sp. tritici (strain CRL 75-36-700-3 / race SCCL) TaxID=418459 RepID=H6QPZ7_PUCGT|nr:uncharacterized protein PGTG_20982 [Puccinia graminis f. sp. tritici CRL 75-36-700-3]EHS64520.1 hypothetical protein PGTG_20982 [Puccinia graminis f. sp. tritici CRL 75-36-700-3]
MSLVAVPEVMGQAQGLIFLAPRASNPTIRWMVWPYHPDSAICKSHPIDAPCRAKVGWHLPVNGLLPLALLAGMTYVKKGMIRPLRLTAGLVRIPGHRGALKHWEATFCRHSSRAASTAITKLFFDLTRCQGPFGCPCPVEAVEIKRYSAPVVAARSSTQKNQQGHI